jgi:hypothetical protein
MVKYIERKTCKTPTSCYQNMLISLSLRYQARFAGNNVLDEGSSYFHVLKA